MVQRSLIVKKVSLVGAGIGLALFLVFGIVHGALLGGTAGLGLVKYVFGEGTLAIMANELLPRIVIGASMLTGVLVAAIMFVVGGSLAGAAAGYALSVLVGAESKAEDMAHAHEPVK